MPINNAIHPSVIVKEMMKDAGIKIFKDYIGVSSAIYAFVRMKTRITPNIAKKLTIIFPNTDAEFWLTIQKDYEVSQLEEEEKC